MDGELLCSLKRAELIQELGLTPLQAAKVLQRLKRWGVFPLPVQKSFPLG